MSSVLERNAFPTDDPDDGEIVSSPFNMRATAPAADMIPPNQVSEYDVSCDTLAGGNFVVGDTIEIVADTSITGKVTAVAANLPTQIEIYQTSDLWKTDDAAANVNIQKSGGGVTCRITAYTSGAPSWRGVNLYAIPTTNIKVSNDCKYFMSPPTVWNSLGDWDNSTQYKLASIFTIDLSGYEQETDLDDFRFCYSCLGDSIDSMANNADRAGWGYGQFSGTVVPYDYGVYSIDNGELVKTDEIYYDSPNPDADDLTTFIGQDDESQLRNYVFRIQLQKPANSNGQLSVYIKKRGVVGDPSNDDPWGDNGYKEVVTGAFPDNPILEIDDADFSTTKLCFETYVMAGIENNANKVQLVIKEKVGAGAWDTIFNMRDMIINNEMFHRLTNRNAKASKKGMPSNIRFSYSHNAALTPNTTKDNFKSFDKIYFAHAYNPIDEENGFVGGAFRSADYITSKNADLPSKLPVQLYSKNVLGDASQDFIAKENPSGGQVVKWDADAENRLFNTQANGGVILGLDEEGFQFVNANSYATGIVFEGNVNVNGRDFPQHYLDLPDLAINNHTGTCNGTGRPNKFVCPLDLNSGQTGKQDVHTSQNETLLYNDLGNAYEERITRLRIRICDIEGTPSSNLGEYTFGCLEVRENPLMRQAKMLRSIMRGEERSALDYQNNLQPNRGNNYQ